MVNYRVKLFGGWLWLWCNICEINKWLAPALSEHVWAVWKHNGSHLVPAAGQREGRKCSHHSKRGTKISTKGECESNLSCVKKVFFKYSNDLHLATSFCNSSDCKSWWLQPDTCFFSTAFFSPHLLRVRWSPRCLSTCGPRGSAAASGCCGCRLAGTEVDWASKDGRCRWAIMACRRSRSLQSC